MSGRLSSFFLGAAAGSVGYYAVTYSMLHKVSRADKRVVEIREELVGMVAAPAAKAKSFALQSLLTPLQPLQSAWNENVHKAKQSVSGLIAPKQPSAIATAAAASKPEESSSSSKAD